MLHTPFMRPFSINSVLLSILMRLLADHVQSEMISAPVTPFRPTLMLHLTFANAKSAVVYSVHTLSCTWRFC